MYVLFESNVFVVELVRADPLLAVRGPQQSDKVSLEVGAVVLDEFLRILADNVHLADMRLGLDVAFEAVCVAALFLARFAPPPEPLKSFRLHLVGEVLRASYFGARHRGGDSVGGTLSGWVGTV